MIRLSLEPLGKLPPLREKKEPEAKIEPAVEKNVIPQEPKKEEAKSVVSKPEVVPEKDNKKPPQKEELKAVMRSVEQKKVAVEEAQ